MTNKYANITNSSGAQTKYYIHTIQPGSRYAYLNYICTCITFSRGYSKSKNKSLFTKDYWVVRNELKKWKESRLWGTMLSNEVQNILRSARDRGFIVGDGGPR